MEHQGWIIEHGEFLLIDAWEKSENLLNNILPIKIAKRTKKKKKKRT